MSDEMFVWVATAGITGVLAILGILSLYLTKWLKTKQKTELSTYAFSFLIRLKDRALVVAKAVAQTYADEIRAAHSDGKLTKEEKERAMEKAIAMFFQGLNIDEALYVLGLKSEGELRQYAVTLIEAAVVELKTTKALTTVPPLRPAA